MLEYMLTPMRKYADFQGRARRKEFWFFALFLLVVYAVAAVLDATLLGAEGPGILYGIVVLATLVPSIAVTVRRLHDIDRTGWWVLIALVPLIGGIVLLVFEVLDGTPGPNKFGPSPKLESSTAFA